MHYEGNAEDLISLMKSNVVVWHTKCRNSVNYQKVQRAKRKEDREDLENVSTPSHIKTRRTEGCSRVSPVCARKCCFFCDEMLKSDDDVRRITTVEVDAKVRAAAHTLCDEKLLRKLLHWDMCDWWLCVPFIIQHACYPSTGEPRTRKVTLCPKWRLAPNQRHQPNGAGA
jgi:hypothetical protein